MLGLFLFIGWLVGFKTRSHCGAQNGFELTVVLSQSPKRWGGRPVPPHLVLWPHPNQWLGSINPLDDWWMQVLLLENVVLWYCVCISVACGVDTRVPDSVWELSQLCRWRPWQAKHGGGCLQWQQWGGRGNKFGSCRLVWLHRKYKAILSFIARTYFKTPKSYRHSLVVEHLFNMPMVLDLIPSAKSK